MNVLLPAEDSETELRSELRQLYPTAEVKGDQHGLLQAEFPLTGSTPLPHLVFCRQVLPEAGVVEAGSIRDWAGTLLQALLERLPEEQAWQLHLEPQYGRRATHHIGARAWHTLRRQGARPSGPRSALEKTVEADAGRHRCALIRQTLEELLRKRRRSLARGLRPRPEPFQPEHSLVQVLLTSPGTGFLSFAPAPFPFAQRHLLSYFPRGEIQVGPDPAAPSRAFAKLLEAELRLGTSIGKGETCVDLGAAPGSWTYVAANRGATVIAIDHSPLREDLMTHPAVEFRAANALKFEPPACADWLLCDLIAAPQTTAELLLEWLRRRWCRRFIVTLKIKAGSALPVIAFLRAELPQLTSSFHLARLCANKKELCVFGLAGKA